MTPEEMAEIGTLNKADLADADMPTHGPAWEKAEAARQKAQQRKFAIEQAIRKRIGEKIVTGSLVAGPAGSEARSRLLQFAPADIAADIRDASPEAQQERDAADDAFNDDLAARSEAVKRRNAIQKKANERARKQAAARDQVEKRIEQDTAANNRKAEADSKHSAQVGRELRADEAAAMHGQMTDTKQLVGLAKQIGLLNRMQQESFNVMQTQGDTTGRLTQQMRERERQIMDLKLQAKWINQQSRTAGSIGIP
jgi:hypothetical protein